MRKLQYEPSLRRQAEGELAEFSSELTRARVRYDKPLVSKVFIPLTKTESWTERTDLVYLKGTPFICYCHSVLSPHKFKPFYISSDFGGFFRSMSSIRFDSYEDMAELAQSDTLVRFAMAITNISPYMFDLAKRNYGVKIPLGYDFERYESMVGTPTALSCSNYEEGIKGREIMSYNINHRMKNILLQSVRRNRR